MENEALNRFNSQKTDFGGFSNKPATGELPTILPSPLMLNLGCGKDVRDKFINIDLFSDDPRVVRMDIRKLDFSDNSVDLILASDVLEHFSHRQTDDILKEWSRVLAPGAEIIIRCPSLRLQLNAYMRGDWDADIASYMIFGGQTNPGDYHCVAFDEITIKKHLLAAGFDNISVEEHNIPQKNGLINLNMTARARKVVKSQGRNPKVSAIEAALSGNVAEISTPADTSKSEAVDVQEDNPDLGDFDFSLGEEDFTEDKGTDINLLSEIVSGADTSIEDDEELIADTQNETDSKSKAKLNLVWEGSQFVYHSLGLINREQVLNLLTSDEINLTVVPYEKETFQPDENSRFKSIAEHDIRYKSDPPDYIASLPYVWIRHQWPPKIQPPAGAKWIIMQPWEFSHLPKDFAELFNEANEIWTPSTFSKNSFVSSGVDESKIHIIPNGVNREVFKPSDEVFPLDTDKRFKILYVGGTIYRKGIDILLKVYSALFKKYHNVALVIKDMGGNSFYIGQTADDMITKLGSMPDAPEIIHLKEELSEQQMASLYRACDLFVSPYRGEGFSLPTLEAMACGLPVAVTEGGATDDFVDTNTGYLIPAERHSIGKMLDGKPFTDEAFLLEPDDKSLADILKAAFDNPGDLKLSGIIGQLRARKDWTWNRSTLKIFERLDSLYDLNLSKNARKKLALEDDALIILGKAENYYQLGNYDKATELFRTAAESDDLPEEYSIHALMRLSIIEINGKNIELAEKYINSAREINSSHPDISYVQAILFAAKGKSTEALETLTPLMENWHDRKYDSSLGINLDDLVVLTGDMFFEQDAIEDAHKLYSKALELNHENPYACYGAGRCFRIAGLDAEAQNMFKWAVKLFPEFEAARKEMMEMSRDN